MEEEIDSFLLVCTSRVGSELARLCLSTLREVDRCDKDEMTSDEPSSSRGTLGCAHGSSVWFGTSMCTSGTPLTFHAFVPTVVGRLIPSDANNGTKVESQYQPSKNSSYRWAHSSSWNLNPEIKRDVVSCLYESEFQARTASLNSKDNLRA